MDIVDFFNHEELEVPYHWSGKYMDFAELLEKKFELYQRCIGEMDDGEFCKSVKDNSKTINENCEFVTQVADKYLNGDLIEAYNIFQKLIEKNEEFIDDLYSNDISGYNQWYFRIRVSDTQLKSVQENFHIPANMRHLVSSQRYSIPGLPCLYLGGSAYICWKELSQPSLDHCYISRYKHFLNNLKVLNFGYRPAYLAAFICSDKNNALHFTKFILAYAVMWPIIFACSVEKKHQEGKFHPEYIIPQMLMQWIAKEQKVDGIRYFSTKIREYPNAPKVNSNFAFPVREFDSDGYCKHLKNLFELTQPKNMQNILDERIIAREVTPNDKESIILLDGTSTLYKNTQYYEIENSLSYFDFQQISHCLNQ